MSLNIPFSAPLFNPKLSIPKLPPNFLQKNTRNMMISPPNYADSLVSSQIWNIFDRNLVLLNKNMMNIIDPSHGFLMNSSSSSDAHDHHEVKYSAVGSKRKEVHDEDHNQTKKKKKVKKTKFAFQTRSQVDILDDGYRWRKYGQKAVKNNRFPRSYYKCTHPGCQVKKQVQRLTNDEGVVVTTYEGTHMHPTQKPNDNFEQILSQMQIYPPF